MRQFIILLPLFMAGCALERAQTAATAQRTMIGMSKEQVLACMGPPGQRSAEGAIALAGSSPVGNNAPI